jgi:2'-5' RNA ligase
MSRDSFESAWIRESELIARGMGEVDFGPRLGALERPPITTIVTRLSQPTAQRIHADAAGIDRKIQGHYLYPADDIHATILSVGDFLNGDGLLDESTLRIIVDEIRKTEPVRLEALGFGVFRTCVFVQLWDPSDAMYELRIRLYEALNRSIKVQASPPRAPELVFANVLRFLHKPEPKIRDVVERLRYRGYGTLRTETAELVSTDKFLSRPATTSVLTIEFGDTVN